MSNRTTRSRNAPPASPAPPPSSAPSAAASPPSSPPSRPGDPSRNEGPAPIPSASILQGRDMVVIEHNGRLYQLRKTRQGKLILTK